MGVDEAPAPYASPPTLERGSGRNRLGGRAFRRWDLGVLPSIPGPPVPFPTTWLLATGAAAAILIGALVLAVNVAQAIQPSKPALAVRSSPLALPSVTLPTPTPPPQAPLPTTTTEQVIPLGRANVRIPILQYHYIRVNPVRNDLLGYNLSVTPSNFAAQMDWLASHGYQPVDLTDLRAYLEGRQVLPARPVVLTFDDGYEDFYTAAYPVLSAHQFKAVAYVVPGFFNRAGFMTADQIKQLDQAGIEIASHTFDHVNLTSQSAAQLTFELSASKVYLERLLGHPVPDFCYPVGSFDTRVELAVAQAGYQSATTQAPGLSHSWSTRFFWTRTRVSGGEGLAAFVSSLGAPEPTVTIVVPVVPPPTPTSEPVIPGTM